MFPHECASVTYKCKFCAPKNLTKWHRETQTRRRSRCKCRTADEVVICIAEQVGDVRRPVDLFDTLVAEAHGQMHDALRLQAVYRWVRSEERGAVTGENG